MNHKHYEMELVDTLKYIRDHVVRRMSLMHDFAIIKLHLEHPQTIDLLLNDLYDCGYWVDSKFLGSNTYLFKIQWENN